MTASAPKPFEAEDYFLLGQLRVLSGQIIEGARVLESGISRRSRPWRRRSNCSPRSSLQTAQVTEATRAAERLTGRPGWEARGRPPPGCDLAPRTTTRPAPSRHCGEPSSETRRSGSCRRTDSARRGCWPAPVAAGPADGRGPRHPCAIRAGRDRIARPPGS